MVIPSSPMVLYFLERLLNKTAANVIGLMLFVSFIGIHAVYSLRKHIDNPYTKNQTPNTPNTNTVTNLTPRQETMSPAIAGARKFLFNSSDPNLEEKNVSISFRGYNREQQFLTTCRPQHLVQRCHFCKVLLGEDGIYISDCLSFSSLLMF